MTPYELRFEIFKQAYAMLQDDYCNRFEVERSKNPDQALPADFDGTYPSLDQVLVQAEIINDFVSSK
jgi:hypothetical protein